jgi:hypothetical protein
MTKALPVCRWQSWQWQQWTNIGSDVSRYRTAPQAHLPLSVASINDPFSPHVRLGSAKLNARPPKPA